MNTCATIFRILYIPILGILAFPFLLLIILLSVPFLAFRFFVSKFSSYLRPDLAKMVTALGHFFAVEDMTQPGSRCVIAITLLFDGDLSVEQVQDLWSYRVVNAECGGHLKYPELQQYITSFALFKFWKADPSFNVKNHVTQCHFSKLEEQLSCGNGELHKLHGYLHNKPFPSKRSPWEILVVQNFPLNNNENGTQREEKLQITPTNVENKEPFTLVAFRFHHCLADGYSIQNLICGDMFAKNLKALQIPRPSIAKVNSGSVSGEQVVKFMLTPFTLFYEAHQFLKTGMYKNVPWLIKDEEKMWRQVVGLTPLIPIESIKEIKRFHGVSFTSVLVSVITGAVSSLLTKFEYSMSNNSEIPVVFVLPVLDHSKKIRNHFTFGLIHIPIGESNPSVRLKKCHQLVERAKTSSGPVFGKCILTFVGSFIQPLVTWMSMNRMIPIVISNFPVAGVEEGLREPAISTGPGRGSGGALITAMSYGSTVRFAINAEQALFSQTDVHQFALSICKEIAVLESEMIC